MSSSSKKTIYSILHEDHQRVKKLLAKLVAVETRDKNTEKILDDITAELVPHARAEEAVFYNSLRQLDMSKEMANHGYIEHVETEALLASLKGFSKVGVQWRAATHKFKDMVEHHIKEEEREVFSAAKQLFLEQEAVEMGRAFQELKREIKNQSALQNTMTIVSNLMPDRFAESFKSFSEIRSSK